MASSTLEAIPAGTRVFIDATVLVYHFTGLSAACKLFLGRCERNELAGVTSVVALAEAAHRLMMVEAVTTGQVTTGQVARKLRERPDIIAGLSVYREQIERVPLMGVEIVGLDVSVLLAGLEQSSRAALMTNDALLVASALDAKATAIASADRDFERAPLPLYHPGDLGPAAPVRR